MARILAIADEVEEHLYGSAVKELEPDLVVSCGDLPFSYLEFIVTMLNVPLLYVPGNHDPDLNPEPRPSLTDGDLRFDQGPPPGPPGCVNVDGEVREAAGLRVAGLGGSIRYRPGPNQYTQREMWRRSLWLEARTRLRRRAIDVLIAHSPPLGLGDGDDHAHQGFAAFHRLVKALSPRLMLHGHIHPYGVEQPDRRLGETRIVNVVPYEVLELDS